MSDSKFLAILIAAFIPLLFISIGIAHYQGQMEGNKVLRAEYRNTIMAECLKHHTKPHGKLTAWEARPLCEVEVWKRMQACEAERCW